MKYLVVVITTFIFLSCTGYKPGTANEEELLQEVLLPPTAKETKRVLAELRKQPLHPREVVVHDTISLANSNTLYVVSHQVEGRRHFGAVILPATRLTQRIPIVVFATGGDGMSRQFDLEQDFNHRAVQYPSFLGEKLDDKFMIVIPSFRGQKLVIGDKAYQSDGDVSDAFNGATTDALALLNVALETFRQGDENRVAFYGGSRGGTVALLAGARDKRIKKVIAVAAPTDMRALYKLYPGQFKLLFFNDLLAGNITTSKARKEFIAISPIYFVSELPEVQIHHDRNDPFVPVKFAQTLTQRLESTGNSPTTFFYDEGIHGFWSDPVYWQRVVGFLESLLD